MVVHVDWSSEERSGLVQTFGNGQLIGNTSSYEIRTQSESSRYWKGPKPGHFEGRSWSGKEEP